MRSHCILGADLQLDIAIPILAVTINTPIVLTGTAAYWLTDTFIYDGNLSKAIRNGRFRRDVRRGFNAVKEFIF